MKTPTSETDEIVKDYHDQRESVGRIIKHAEDLERENERLRTALEVINTWASSDTSFNDVMEDICEHSKEVLFPH
jgi:phage host-nuclease inhibitor protein Gam